MKRLWIVTSCLAGIGFNTPAYSMALGEVDLRSALNEPLNAAIEVFGTDQVSQEQVKFSIANAEAFTAAGLDRPYFLNQITFNWASDKNGHRYLQLTTQEPIREPFLDFLLEVNWPNGHLMREFTLLLDPPTFAEEAPATYPIERTVKPTAIPLQEVRETLAERAQAEALAQSQGTYSNQAPTKSGQYGPTQAGDTLWKIAEDAAKGTNVMPQQFMLAIYQENPQAFMNNNIHLLKRHAVLQIPSAERAGLVTREQAIKGLEQVKAAPKANHKPTKAAALAKETLSTVTPAGATSGVNIPLTDLIEDFPVQQPVQEAAPQPIQQAPVQAPVQQAAPTSAPAPVVASKAPVAPQVPVAPVAQAANDAQRLQILTPKTAQSVTSAPQAGQVAAGQENSVTELRQALTASKEALDTAQRNNEEMSARLAQLETQLNSMRELMILQGKASGAVGANPNATPNVASDANANVATNVNAAGVVNTNGTLTAQAPVAVPAVTPAQVPPATTQNVVGNAPAPVDNETAAKLNDINNMNQAITPKAPEQKPAAKKVIPPINLNATKPGEIAPVEQDSHHALIWTLFASLLATVTFAGLVLHRGWLRRHEEEDAIDLDEEMEETETEPAEEAVAETPIAAEVVPTEEYLNDGSKPMSVGHDPEEEADILIAFGRFNDAEQVLQIAMRLQPEQQELRIKLLQVYIKANQQAAYQEQFPLVSAEFWEAHPDVKENLQYQAQKAWPVKATEPTQAQMIAAALATPVNPEPAALIPEPAKPQVLPIQEAPPKPIFEKAVLKQAQDGSIEYEPPKSLDELNKPKPVTQAADQYENTVEWSKNHPVQDLDGEDLSVTATTSIDDDVATKLELARAYLEIGDIEGARDILEEVMGMGTAEQQEDAKALLNSM